MRTILSFALLLPWGSAFAAPPASAATDSRVEVLAAAATREIKARQPERALVHLNECVEVAPKAPVCHRLLGSAYALLASLKKDVTYTEKARGAYLRFLELAPPDDEYVPKVKAIIEGAPPPVAPASKRPVSKASAVRSPEEEALAAAEQAIQQRQLERALVELEKCVAGAPKYAPCHRVLGATYARIALRDGSDQARAKARRAYERFLEVAAPDDPYVSRVRVMLEEAQRE
jgi:Flp pilus assembly protein TadD